MLVRPTAHVTVNKLKSTGNSHDDLSFIAYLTHSLIMEPILER